MSIATEEILLTGALICRGIAIGPPHFFKIPEEEIPEVPVSFEDIDAEVVRYQQAILKAREDIQYLQNKLQAERILDGAAILDAHLQMTQDPLLTTHVEQLIKSSGKNAEYVFHNIINQYRKKFNAIADPFFRERFKDIQDVSRRVIGHLCGNAEVCFGDIPPDSIIFATDLSAFDTAEASGARVAAFVTQSGGATSHAAIVAKAKGIPYVSSIDFEKIKGLGEGVVIVDGRSGKIILNPSAESLLKYQKLRELLHLHQQKLKLISTLPAETFDGYKVQVSANIETLSEIDSHHQYGGSGVGLLRTESIFLSKDSFPSEEEQFSSYRLFVENMNNLPIVIRVFDWGGDKYLHKQRTIREINPFLGCRAIRFLLREKALFKSQLRAILRASAFGKISVMFPLVSSLSELREAKAIFNEVRQELIDRGDNIASHIPIGCMIEVPSAAIIADLLAKECDFLSIGTNDLVQYALAVDRGNHALSDLYSPTHPCVIRLIRLIVSEANFHNVPVAICGEIAADPRFTSLLLGLGIRELSVSPRYMPMIKNAIRSTSIVAASHLADQALSLSTAADIEALISQEYKRNVPDDCFYTC